MRKLSVRLVAGIAALGLVAAACAEDDDDASDDSAAEEAEAEEPAEEEPAEEEPAEEEPAEEEPAEEADAEEEPADEEPAEEEPAEEEPAEEEPAAGDVSETLQWALDYTGGVNEEASGEPLKIGYVNQEAVFPENTVGVQAAIDFVNTELGGFGGRPAELVSCEVLADEDGTRCGTEMLNDDEISFVLTGTLLNGNQQLYDVLDGQKPVIIGNAVTNPDFLTTAGAGFTTGSIGVIPGLAEYAINRLDPPATNAAVVYANNPAGQAAFQALLKPVFDLNGIPVTAVEVVDPGATAADIQAAMIAAGADTADVFIPLVTVQSCIATYDAINQLGIDPTVVTTGLCFGTPMTDHLESLGDGGEVPDGWYFGGYGYSYFIPDLESGMMTYLEKVEEYAQVPEGVTLEFTGFAGPSFANVMTIAKFANELGGEVDSAGMQEKIFGFSGPMMIQAGTLTCGGTTVLGIPFPAVCGNVMGIQQYADGEWVSAGDALDGNPIDVTTIGT